MSAVNGSYTYEMDASYAADFSRDREQTKTRSRHPEYRRKGSAPTRVSGMHCRRNKRWSWGSGRGARMANLRAFAGCLAVAVAAIAGSASAQVNLLDMLTIGNPGNFANTNGLGAVANTFYMSRSETTNAQYVEFLNKVDASGTNPFGVYNSSMGSNAAGGITFNAAAGSGAKYSVKSGAPAGAPAGTSYGNMPVNFTSWFSAARYVNWLEAGQPTNSTAMNAGVYTVNSATSGAIVARNPGTTYFLPSSNEWYKAGFYNGTSYTGFPTNSGSQPAATIASGSLANPNTGNWGQVATFPVNVDAYSNTTSAYGLYGMWGNVLEFTDTAGTTSGNVLTFGANYNTLLSNANQWGAAGTGVQVPSTFTSGAGFRVGSSIAPVPEPETITLAAFGIVGLCGANWLKRRRKAGALAADLVAA
ncbi:MAG: SUMF1/EgtB/PvdO family nonheme iron enzyme [Planctomycetaceae bacterium]